MTKLIDITGQRFGYLCAPWNMSAVANGNAGVTAAVCTTACGRRIIFGSAEIAAILALQPCRSERFLVGPGSTRPERHFPSGAAQTRIVSVARIRLILPTF